MSTELPNIANCKQEAREWWANLSAQGRIIAALDFVYQNASISGFPRPGYVAEKPWKWASEAYASYLEEREATP